MAFPKRNNAPPLPAKKVMAYVPKVRSLEQNATVLAQRLKDYIILIYGPPGAGKTTFVNEIYDNVLFISTDRGTRTQVARREEAFTYEDFMDLLHTLETQRDKYPYDAVCIDHVDDMAQMFEAYICKQLQIDSLGDAEGGFGKGYKLFRDAINDYVRRLLRLDYGVAFIAHEEVKNVEVRGVKFQRTMPAMSKSAWKVIVPLADLMGYAGLRTVKNEETNKLEDIRILQTIPRQDLDAKDRTRRDKPAAGTYEYLDGKQFRDTFNETGDSDHGTNATARIQDPRPSRALPSAGASPAGPQGRRGAAATSAGPNAVRALPPTTGRGAPGARLQTSPARTPARPGAAGGAVRGPVGRRGAR